MNKVIAGIAAAAMFVAASPAFASHWASDIDVYVKNSGTTVVNGVSTGAYTGGNTADGGSATTKVKNSGNINGNKDDNNTTGGGTTDSDGGNGGTVTTGKAKADSTVWNDVNSTDIKVKTECGCKGDIDVRVKNKNTTVVNEVGTLADTGLNSTDGGSATTKVKDSGNINGNKDDNNTTGGGTTDSDGGNGGTVTAGEAKATSSVGSVVNSTVIRVRKI